LCRGAASCSRGGLTPAQGLPLWTSQHGKNSQTHPLHVAARNGSLQALEFLVKRGAAPSPSVVRRQGLRRGGAGALVDIRDDAGMTPLMVAIDAQKNPAIELLIRLGADVNAFSSSVRRCGRWSAVV
jgi:ankyrin repeat protein